jgi:hypothetical protein
MKAKRILAEEVASMTVSSLPARPTAPREAGGRGYSAAEMRAAFDRLPLYIIERFNRLIEDIEAVGEGSLAASVRTGITELHTLTDLFDDIVNGRLASYLTVGDASLEYTLAQIQMRLDELERKD